MRHDLIDAVIAELSQPEWGDSEGAAQRVEKLKEYRAWAEELRVCNLTFNNECMELRRYLARAQRSVSGSGQEVTTEAIRAMRDITLALAEKLSPRPDREEAGKLTPRDLLDSLRPRTP